MKTACLTWLCFWCLRFPTSEALLRQIGQDEASMLGRLLSSLPHVRLLKGVASASVKALNNMFEDLPRSRVDRAVPTPLTFSSYGPGRTGRRMLRLSHPEDDWKLSVWEVRACVSCFLVQARVHFPVSLAGLVCRTPQLLILACFGMICGQFPSNRSGDTKKLTRRYRQLFSFWKPQAILRQPRSVRRLICLSGSQPTHGLHRHDVCVHRQVPGSRGH